jgi:hypothetical protein
MGIIILFKMIFLKRKKGKKNLSFPSFPEQKERKVNTPSFQANKLSKVKIQYFSKLTTT